MTNERVDRVAAVLFLALGIAWTARHAEARTLTVEERLRAREAIERVYWSHRIWPKENAGTKPPLSSVISTGAIRAGVEEDLKKSRALETWWGRPITAKQLQAEMDRMAKRSRDPRLLRELIAALGNDPFVIAETLARHTLADRLVRSWYAGDERFGGAGRDQVHGECNADTQAGDDTNLGGVHQDDICDGIDGAASILTASRDVLRTRYEASPGESSEDGERDAGFDDWWRSERVALPDRVEELPDTFTLPVLPSDGCTNDTWKPTRQDFPDPRYYHTAIWTGTEMIVWGGKPSWPAVNTGGRYDPATDTWSVISIGENVPVGRGHHTAVWTGTEMIVWGGEDYSTSTGITEYMGTGGRYDPVLDRWLPVSTGANAPSPRTHHTAVWTGSEMIVWGGQTGSPVFTQTGGRYDPATDTWTPTSTGPGAPAGRSDHTAVWTGTEMIVWGGRSSFPERLDSGGRYDPSTDTWTPTSSVNVPGARSGHLVVWTGTEMIVWGPDMTTGGRYRPATDTWTATSTGPGVPGPRTDATAVWTGKEMIVWGGWSSGPIGTGARYDPAADRWSPVSSGPNRPSVRFAHTAIWTGTEMIVWGGYDNIDFPTIGGRYDPAADRWTPTSTSTTAPVIRATPVGVWTGTEMLVLFSPSLEEGFKARAARYDPATDSWTRTAWDTNTPTRTVGMAAVWTGTQMIVWGGIFGPGARYDPAADAWTPVSSGPGAPSPRANPLAVWTGKEMIVWAGWYSNGSVQYLDTGGRYDPATDLWRPTSVGPNVPSGRQGGSAVWTGREMIVWGGTNGAPLGTGGRYDPVSDSWSATSTGPNAPTPRQGNTAVWTGTEMIVWGGNPANASTNTGARYDPATDRWTPTSIGEDVPAPRLHGHAAVWTGSEMIVWGGHRTSGLVSTGGRYDPATDRWTAISNGANTPGGREFPVAAWTGRELILWGGLATTSTGGIYCACPNGTLVHRDADSDGFGDAAVSIASCDGSIPAGYVGNAKDCDDGDPNNWASCASCVDADGDGERAGCDRYVTIAGPDCDDADASVHHGAVESCNGVDDDCNGRIDDAGTVTGLVVGPTAAGTRTRRTEARDGLAPAATRRPESALRPGSLGTLPTDSMMRRGAGDGRGGAVASSSSRTLFADHRLSWNEVPEATGYDVVSGRVEILHATSGEFSSAVDTCLADDLASTFVDDPRAPAPGAGLFYLVRAVGCGAAGSYDSGEPGRIRPRDAGIQASPAHCP